jgi:O-antigen/teichoic acid export membrane protein
VLKSVGSNWALNIVAIVVGFILTPALIHLLGVPANGVWQEVVSLTNFLSLFLLGVPMATVREFTQHITHKDQDRLNRAISSAMWLYLGMGIAACAVGMALYPFFDRVYTHKEGVTDAVGAQARIAFVITVLQLAFAFVSQVPSAVMTAHRDFLVRNTIAIGGLLFRLVMILTWLRANGSLTVLALILTLQMLLELAASSIIVLRKYPGTRLWFGVFDKTEVRSIVGFSLYVLLLAIGYKLLFMTSPLILGAFRSPKEVAAFEPGKSLVLFLTEFVLAIGAVAMPTAVKLKLENREKELADIFLQWSKVAFSIALVAGLYLVVLGTDFIRQWVRDPEFDAEGAGDVNMILMISHFIFLPVRGVGIPILMGLGKPERATVALLASGLLNVVIGLALVKPLGMIGVALGIAIPDALFAFYALHLVCKELGVPIQQYVRYVGAKACIGSIPVLAFLFLLERVVVIDGRIPVILCGVASTAVFAIVWVAYVYRNDPYIDAAGRLKRLFAFARKGAS